MIGATSDLTLTDFFCGAGGSSTGAVAALAGRGRVAMAANHWQRAIETHQTNHPTTDHDLADLVREHPSRFPRTTMAWFSPECTNHSVAKGRRRKNIAQMDLFGETGVDPSEERSRATMREVVEFSAWHRYEIVIVENVVDIRWWVHYDAWLRDMINLGYDYRTLYLNAQFFGVPQSRDRIYVVFWRRGNRTPDLDFRPVALCPQHGQIRAVQSWKKRDNTWGRFKRQYVYRCPHCAAEVVPAYAPAYTVIDWSIPAPRIGDRDKALKPKTLDRVRAGLRKFARRAVILDTAFADGPRVTSIDDPLMTQTARQTLALLQPFIASQHEGRQAVRDLGRELPCITTMNNEHSLVIPPFLSLFYGVINQSAIDAPLPTILSAPKHGLIIPPFLAVMKNSHSADGTYTLPPLSMDDPLTTIVAAGSQHALIVPPMLVSTNHSDVERSTSAGQPLPTIMTQARPSLIVPPFLASYYGTMNTAEVGEAMPTVTATDRHALVTPQVLITDEPVEGLDVEALLPECGFRMLEPHELKLGMSFPSSYVVLGNKREQVRQIGNAVACNVAEWIVARCADSLH